MDGTCRGYPAGTDETYSIGLDGPYPHHLPGATSGIAVNKERRASAELMHHMSSMSKLFA